MDEVYKCREGGWVEERVRCGGGREAELECGRRDGVKREKL